MKTSSRALAALTLTLLLAIASLAGSGHAASTAAPANTAPPTIAGTAAVAQVLTAENGTWTNSPASFAYQWLRCNGGGNSCASIAGATLKTYTLVTADAGSTIRVRVTATNADGSGAAQSAHTASVTAAAGGGIPKETTAPIISGTPKVGQALTSDQGSWGGNPTSFAYQWQHCDADNIAACTNVVGATSSTYVLKTADVGFRMRVRVTAKNAKGSATANAPVTSIITPAITITNHRPSVTIVSVRFAGSTVYARFRICDDSLKNLTIIETDSRPGKPSYTRRFTTLIAPKPCGVYTRHWLPVARFQGPGTFTLTLRARDMSGLTSLPARRTFSHG